MTSPRRTDDNHAATMDGLRRCGYRVEDLSQLGGGVPDLLVGTPWGTLALVEVKDGDKPPSARKLTPDQTQWHRAWFRFPVFVVVSPQDAVHQLTEERARLRRIESERGRTW